MYPFDRNRSLQSTRAMPAISPMVTRPAGPIQLLSNANFKKYEMPIRTAVIPMRLSHCEPMRDSRSRSGGAGVRVVEARGGIFGSGGSGARGAFGRGAYGTGDGGTGLLLGSGDGIPRVSSARSS